MGDVDRANDETGGEARERVVEQEGDGRMMESVVSPERCYTQEAANAIERK